MRPRIMLANEFGGGRGHLVTLCRVGQAFGPAFDFDAALGARLHEDALSPLHPTVFDGPKLVNRNARRQGPNAVLAATWAELLGDLGFDRVQRLRDVVGWWQKVLIDRGIALVIADYAPLALLAARSLGIASIATGTGFGLPPPDLPRFPILNHNNTLCLHDEAQLLDTLNTVVSEIGLPPLAGVPEVYHSTLPLVRTLPGLDPYRACRTSPYFSPVTDVCPPNPQPGAEVFVYFSTASMTDPDVVDALCRLPLPRRGYLPATPPDVAARLVASGMILEAHPLPMALIAKRSRLVLSAGQHGILCLGLHAGLPQVALPQHQEQTHHAECAAEMGSTRVILKPARTSKTIFDAISDAYTDKLMWKSAQEVAADLNSGPLAPSKSTLQHAIDPLRSALLAGTV